MARIEEATGQSLYVEPGLPRARHARPGWTLPGFDAPAERLARRAEPPVLLDRRVAEPEEALAPAEWVQDEPVAAPLLGHARRHVPDHDPAAALLLERFVAAAEPVLARTGASTASVPVVVEPRAEASLTPSSTSSHRVTRSLPRQRRVVREATPVTDSLREPTRPRRRAIDVERGVARDVVLDLDAAAQPSEPAELTEPARYEVPQDLARRLIDLSIPAGRGRHRAPEGVEQTV